MVRKSKTVIDLEARLDARDKECGLLEMAFRDAHQCVAHDGQEIVDVGEGELPLIISLYRARAPHGGYVVIAQGRDLDVNYLDDEVSHWRSTAALLGDWRYSVRDALERLTRKRNAIVSA